MARRKLEDRNIRKLSKRGSSYTITLPIEAVRQLRWRDGQKVVVEEKGESLIIKDWKK
jgi:antitoxin component of MazEF toxin-antitoxin module